MKEEKDDEKGNCDGNKVKSDQESNDENQDEVWNLCKTLKCLLEILINMRCAVVIELK